MLRARAWRLWGRTDFDLLRIVSHQLETVNGESVSITSRRRRCLRKSKTVGGYNVWRPGASSRSRSTQPGSGRNGHAPKGRTGGLIRSRTILLYQRNAWTILHHDGIAAGSRGGSPVNDFPTAATPDLTLMFIVLTVNAYRCGSERKLVRAHPVPLGPHRVGPHVDCCSPWRTAVPLKRIRPAGVGPLRLFSGAVAVASHADPSRSSVWADPCPGKYSGKRCIWEFCRRM